MIEDKNDEIEPLPLDDEKKSEPISIAARNLRLLKRIVLGKKKPSRFLRILCWFNMGWSSLMIIYYSIVGLLIKTAFIHDNVLSTIGGKYFFVYALLHAFALLGTILIWRLKKIGFYIFSISTIIMPFLYLAMTWNLETELSDKTSKFEWIVLLFSITTIALFAINWKSLNLVKKKNEEG